MSEQSASLRGESLPRQIRGRFNIRARSYIMKRAEEQRPYKQMRRKFRKALLAQQRAEDARRIENAIIEFDDVRETTEMDAYFDKDGLLVTQVIDKETGVASKLPASRKLPSK